MNENRTGESNKPTQEKQQDGDQVTAVNPNPAANDNIKPQLDEMNTAEKQKASELPNSEITDGEDG